jgi:hypothetical protein
MTEQPFEAAPAKGSAHYQALRFNAEDHLHHLADLECSEAEAKELLESIWSIVVGFVDLGFSIHSNDPVGRLFGDVAGAGLHDAKVLQSPNTIPDKTKKQRPLSAKAQSGAKEDS